MHDSNSLSRHCLLDGDPEAVRQTRRRRARSLGLSIALQALCITVIVVAPLLATGRLSLQTQAPVVIYQGRYSPVEVSGTRTAASNTTRRSGAFVPTRPMQPIRIPDRIATIVDETGPPGSNASLDGCPTCREDGQLPPIFGQPRQEVLPPPLVDRSASTQPVRVSRSLQEAKLIHRVDPTYPPLCRQIRVEGEVHLKAIVARDGSMRELTFVSGHACFVQHSMQAVAQWRYQPTLLNGHAVEVETTITVIYRLNR
jgi:protein TonB